MAKEGRGGGSESRHAPVSDMFWGDRFGKVADPFGHHWGIATHKEDLAPQEIHQRQAEWEKQMARKK